MKKVLIVCLLIFLSIGIKAQTDKTAATIFSNAVQREAPNSIKEKEGNYQGGYYTTLNFGYSSFVTVSNIVTRVVKSYNDLILVKAWYKGEDGMLTSTYNIEDTKYYITVIYFQDEDISYLIIGAIDLSI